MIEIIIRLHFVKAAVQACAKGVAPFSRQRVTDPFDWIAERKRFAFGCDDVRFIQQNTSRSEVV